MTQAVPSAGPHRVVIVGGGFGGLHTAKGLRSSSVEITLIDRRNFHLFQPLLYQVATGALSPANIAAPLRHVLSRQTNCRVLLGEVIGVEMNPRQLILEGGRSVPFDALVVAAGASHSYFGKNEWEQFAPGLKTIEDATEIRASVLTAFESAELETDPEKRQACLNFVVIGGGPTGVELAGALAETARHTLKHDFRSIDPTEAKVLLIEAADRILTSFPPALSEKARHSLTSLGATVRTNTKVIDLKQGQVTLQAGDQTEVIEAKTILWAAGVQASPLAKLIAEATGAERDRAGRVIVEPDFSVAGHPEVFVIGDMAHYAHHAGKPLPGVAPVAIQAGKYVSKRIRAQLEGKPVPKFVYHDRGNLATIGKYSAIADFGWTRFSGFFAWFLWLVVHLMNIVSFRNRLLVLIQWGWNYLTYDRSARLITGEEQQKNPPASAS